MVTDLQGRAGVKKKRAEKSASSVTLLVVEIVVYAGLVAAYLAFALKALAPFLRAQAEHHRATYALLCVGLMLGQGIVLELATDLLVRVFARSQE
jgi:heme/copper-type cytochrome/quinol oxidase subunit 3